MKVKINIEEIDVNNSGLPIMVKANTNDIFMLAKSSNGKGICIIDMKTGSIYSDTFRSVKDFIKSRSDIRILSSEINVKML